MSALSRLGPGLMMAATAVGVSHLVHSTRAGATYGLTMVGVVVVIVLLKYPAFRFSAEYASRTGRSLIYAYFRMGNWAKFWLILTMMIELFVGAAVLSLVTAGVLINIFDLSIPGPVGAIIVAITTAAILFHGRYSSAENIIKFLVGAFSVMTLVATMIAIPRLGADGREVFASAGADVMTISFVIAMAGYMPLPLAVAIFQSIWVREKKRTSDYTVSQAAFDLNVGWWLTALLALCFMLMGAAVLFQTGTELPASAPGFAAMLFGIFTTLAGDWIFPILAIGGLAVIWSTAVAVMDAVPRIFDRIWHEVGPAADPDVNYYRRFMVLQLLAAAFVLTVFTTEFSTFIDIAAGLTFLIAPAVAWFNFRALRDIGEMPPRYLVVWNYVSIAAFTVIAVTFLLLRLT